MRILGIETSFDDTGVAVYDSDSGLLINELYSQSMHNQYGGVVPELAARDHVNKLAPLIFSIMENKKISFNTINAIAYTAGPGLAGSLLVGAALSCSLAYSCGIPVIPINHMEGHLLSPRLTNNIFNFPVVVLLISGKHTQLIFASKFGKYDLLGETLDDAVGEVFDKIAKALNLGYPGGSKLSHFAKNGRGGTFRFPTPMKYSNNFNFSFSGIKTFTLNLINKNFGDINICYDIAYGFEHAIVDVLIYKCHQALKKMGVNRLVIAGGVSANMTLITKMKDMLKLHNGILYVPDPIFCTDNAAMIAYAGMLRFKKKKYTNIDIMVNPNWVITDI
ncbi:tRNA N6-adenosine threonylcarbamoyltransferase [Buchnera aphidicola (Pterocallis alni)]|uniref:tRNA (adenosine(37)-N6)-threonylcarbamoyltransferase complex transferase subunit TsaD n=1 Tax=Buchnera aphidicola TaxID=9 RepID=UPI003463AB80